ncbi:V-type ATP synthase subunit I [Yeguia hominis]|uniref:V-type ATP synthase subunit I n=1 Tax=Yeguia hominis TaxID=2763662 RepID=A0A926HS45_9FIRM|nr:V-type ATP synthase subunit I [Yeguia hominis]MBC8534439.1 V-type ATP synthase subunit I [Yeguia hominis]
MAVLQMQHIAICALKKDRKAILELLQRRGVVEISDDLAEDDVFHKADVSASQTIFTKNALTADYALEVLQEYAPEKTSMLASLNGKEQISLERYDEIAKRHDAVIDVAKQILALTKQIAEDKASLLKTETKIEALTPWLSLDVPMNFSGTEQTAAFIGSIGESMTLEAFYQRLAAIAPDLEAFTAEILSQDANQTCLFVTCLRQEQAKMEEALRESGFSRPAQNIREVPAERLERLRTKLSETEKEIRNLETEIAGFKDSREDLRLVSDYYQTRAEKYRVLGGLLQSKKTFVLTGYIPERNAGALKSELESKFDLSVECYAPSEEEEPPVLLQNAKVPAAVEGVVESYGLPGKGDMDPTSVMSIFYYAFFGLMLSDAAYGFVIFLACFILLKKFKNMEISMQKSLRMFMYCGISTMFWGVMFSSYFGDVVDVVSTTFFGHPVSVPPVWFIPLEEPMRMLLYSLLFGTIHLFTGLGMKGYMLLRDRKIVDFFCDVVLWFCLLIGLLIMLLPSSLFASIAQMEIVFPAFVNTLGKVLAIGGAVGICLMSGRANRNWGKRIALGAYDLYNITGWLSDVLSYSRLLALGLATGVIASVINQMGSMIGNNFFGIVAFIIIFILGHTLNLAINMLGAYVHTNRLQFVEFFGKFYEGGGRAFNPFRTNTKYTNIKEEIKS